MAGAYGLLYSYDNIYRTKNELFSFFVKPIKVTIHRPVFMFIFLKMLAILSVNLLVISFLNCIGIIDAIAKNVNVDLK
jgi:hypothetical protein